MNWLRLYTETKDDPKIGSLSDSEFRTFIEALCWAAQVQEGGNTGITQQSADWAFRRNVTSDVSSLLQKQFLVLEKNGTLSVKNWDKRQPKSAESTDRVRKHRENKKGNVPETLPERCGNALEKNRIEKKREEKTNTAADFVEAWNALPAPYPKVQRLTDNRRAAFRTRCSDPWWRDNWIAAMAKLALSEFCKGGGSTAWVADADWFLRPDSVAKLMEGKYDPRTVTHDERGFVESDMPQYTIADKVRADLAAMEAEA
jgi:hypothetical protein